MTIPILLPGNEGEPQREVDASVDPSEIQCYYPGYHFGTMIYLKGGHCLMSQKDVKDIQFNINAYWKKVQEAGNGNKILSLQ